MKHKNKVNVFDFVWVFIAAIIFGLRYIKIMVVDFGFFGSSYVTIVQKVSDCNSIIVSALQTCQNVNTINTVWWIVIGILVIIQLVVIFNKLKK